jgi:hypothetical protein
MTDKLMDDEIITISRKALMTAAHDAAAHMETFVLNVDTLKEQQHKHPVECLACRGDSKMAATCSHGQPSQNPDSGLLPNDGRGFFGKPTKNKENE